MQKAANTNQDKKNYSGTIEIAPILTSRNTTMMVSSGLNSDRERGQSMVLSSLNHEPYKEITRPSMIGHKKMSGAESEERKAVFPKTPMKKNPRTKYGSYSNKAN